ncbi:1780_t:CDS:2 [Entrophospora sp. SA101]|nr:1780_t:CDS:2 [Entrophospora sp. SA101]
MSVNESSDGKDDGGEDEEVLRVEDAVKDVIGVDVVGGTGPEIGNLSFFAILSPLFFLKCEGDDNDDGDDGKDIDVEGNCGIVGEDIVVGEEKFNLVDLLLKRRGTAGDEKPVIKKWTDCSIHENSISSSSPAMKALKIRLCPDKQKILKWYCTTKYVKPVLSRERGRKDVNFHSSTILNQADNQAPKFSAVEENRDAAIVSL